MCAAARLPATPVRARRGLRARLKDRAGWTADMKIDAQVSGAHYPQYWPPGVPSDALHPPRTSGADGTQPQAAGRRQIERNISDGRARHLRADGDGLIYV